MLTFYNIFYYITIYSIIFNILHMIYMCFIKIYKYILYMYNIYLLKHMNRSTKTETFLCDSKVTPPALSHFLTHFSNFTSIFLNFSSVLLVQKAWQHLYYVVISFSECQSIFIEFHAKQNLQRGNCSLKAVFIFYQRNTGHAFMDISVRIAIEREKLISMCFSKRMPSTNNAHLSEVLLMEIYSKVSWKLQI